MFVTVKSQLVGVVSTVVGEVALLLLPYTGLNQLTVSKYIVLALTYPVATSDWSVPQALALWLRQAAARQHHIVQSYLGGVNCVGLLDKYNLQSSSLVFSSLSADILPRIDLSSFPVQ